MYHIYTHIYIIYVSYIYDFSEYEERKNTANLFLVAGLFMIAKTEKEIIIKCII